MKRPENEDKCTAANERFGATAAGRADLKGSAGMPPLRQAAIPLSASGEKAMESERIRLSIMTIFLTNLKKKFPSQKKVLSLPRN